MNLTYKFKIKSNKSLDSNSNLSKNLYNQANYIIRNRFIETGEYLNYFEMDKIMKETKNLEGDCNYNLLPVQTSQQILKLLDKNWKSYFKSIKDYYKNKSKYLGKPKMPNYKREDKNILIFTNQTMKFVNGRLKNKKSNINIRIPNYSGKDFNTFQQVRILPRKDYYEVEIVYKQLEINNKLNSDKVLSIDLGVNNFLTCVTNDKTVKPFIVNGKELKAVNQYYNKQISKLKKIQTNGKDVLKNKDKKYFKNTKRMDNVFEYRNNYIKDKMHKMSSFIVTYCLKNKIGNICVGALTGMKNNSNLSKKSNQQIQQIPIQNFKQLLKYKCELQGIKYIEVEEAYTSKCSALDLEPIQKQESYIGKRVKRGLFKSSKGLINADVNGSLNILRKVIGDNQFTDLVDSRIWYNPVKIRELNSNSFEQFLARCVNIV